MVNSCITEKDTVMVDNSKYMKSFLIMVKCRVVIDINGKNCVVICLLLTLLVICLLLIILKKMKVDIIIVK